MANRIPRIRKYNRSRALTLPATNHSTAKNLIAGRDANMKLLREHTSDLDLLIIGGGATGSGAALDAALRGLKVACIEREDFSSGTSSRSTKLLWGGSRYLVQAFISLLSSRLVARPIQTVKNFITDFRMVLNCHRERRFLLEKQPHLTKWMPIAVPLDRWVLWPPPFGFIPAALGPLGLFPLFFKFVSYNAAVFVVDVREVMINVCTGYYNLVRRVEQLLLSTITHHGSSSSEKEVSPVSCK